ncbi:MAG: outer membrane protein assembly factor BamE [Alphaproteobacteria bacterium]|nr:MAG: outer membrane protein assembly factor BamE [Alphaproteobacteria bacterium]
MLLLSMSACSLVQTPRILHGNRIDPDQLKELVPGVSTKKDVSSLVGSPTTRATFDDNEWIYISETNYSRIGRLPGIMKQDVTVMSFTPNGTLKGVKTLTQEDARDISVASGATPSPGSEASFLQQLLGNVGKYSVGNLGGGDASTVGSSGAATSR